MGGGCLKGHICPGGWVCWSSCEDLSWHTGICGSVVVVVLLECLIETAAGEKRKENGQRHQKDAKRIQKYHSKTGKIQLCQVQMCAAQKAKPHHHFFSGAICLIVKNVTHIPATETATAQKSRGRHNANVVGALTSPSHCTGSCSA